MPLTQVPTGMIEDGSVNAAKLASNAVTSDKIASQAVTPSKLSQPLTQGTSQATTSGTSKDFTSIPSWVKRITVAFDNVSISGNNDILVQLGDSGGIETTGYVSSGTNMFAGGTTTSGYMVRMSNSAFAFSGLVTIVNVSGNLWVASVAGNTNNATYAAVVGGGTKTLSDVLTQLRITTSNGTDTFDSGSVNILYE